MQATWRRFDDGEWGVRLTQPEYPPSTWVGLPVTVRSRSGKKRNVVLGEHVRTFRIKGGVIVAEFRVESRSHTETEREE